MNKRNDLAPAHSSRSTDPQAQISRGSNRVPNKRLTRENTTRLQREPPNVVVTSVWLQRAYNEDSSCNVVEAWLQRFDELHDQLSSKPLRLSCCCCQKACILAACTLRSLKGDIAPLLHYLHESSCGAICGLDQRLVAGGLQI